VAWVVARLTFRPVVIYAHGEELTTWGHGGKYKAMRFALRHANRVIANSEFTRDELVHMGVPEDKIALIYPGVDTDRFRPGLPCDDLKRSIGLAPDQNLILSVGRLQRRKGFDMVIKSLPGLLEQGLDVRYALIGIGEDWDYLHELAEANGVADRVHFLGHMPPEDLPRWYNACDVFVMPNRDINGDTEGFGMVFIEAAACSKPVIAGMAGGTGAAVKDGETGNRVDGTRLDCVASTISSVLKNGDLRASYAMHAVARAQQMFSWDSVADRTRQLSARH